MSLYRFRTALIVLVALAGSGHVFARQSGSSTSPSRRVEGDWVRTDPLGAGSFGGLGAQIPAAVLTPEAMAARQGGPGRGGAGGRGAAPAPPRGPAFTQTTANAAGQPYIVVSQPCGAGPVVGNGAGMINPDSGGIHLIEQKDEVIFAGERGGSRRIYVDGRTHPDPTRWTPSGAGHSIGHYEGDVLVIDTTGFAPGAVAGGGQRGPDTHLTERLEVSPDGQKMTITYTWVDPKIYAKPHTYHLIFDRVPPVSYAFDEWCDASDPVEQQSITPPKQLE